MYMILQFIPINTQLHAGDYVTPIVNEDGSVKLFDTVKEADHYANTSGNSDEMKVISIEGVKE